MTTKTSKHTPGPWVIGERDGNRLRIEPGIALVLGDGIGPAANATLIAKAPEMLQALLLLLSLVDSGSLEIGYMDKRETEADVARTRVLLAEIAGA